MPTGLGLAPFGVGSLFGFGSIDAAPIQHQTILIDGNNGNPQNARRIDPLTKQYVYDSLSRVQGMSGVQQLVLLRAATVLNSSAIPGFGMRPPAGVIGANATRQLADDITVAMQDLVDAKMIEIIDVQVERIAGTGQFRRFFKWRDLTISNAPGLSGAEQVTTL